MNVLDVDLAQVPALTLLNPWGHAIAHADKRVENRSWPPPARTRFLLIHAGKRWDPAGTAALLSRGIDVSDAAGGIVALAELVDVCAASARRASCQCGDWAAAGQYHWRLGAVVALPVPVPCRGSQRLWRPPPLVLAAVASALPRPGAGAVPVHGQALGDE